MQQMRQLDRTVYGSTGLHGCTMSPRNIDMERSTVAGEKRSLLTSGLFVRNSVACRVYGCHLDRAGPW